MTCETPGCNVSQRFLHENLKNFCATIQCCCRCNSCELEPDTYCRSYPSKPRKR